MRLAARCTPGAPGRIRSQPDRDPAGPADRFGCSKRAL